jgi:hypothetical protein
MKLLKGVILAISVLGFSVAFAAKPTLEDCPCYSSSAISEIAGASCYWDYTYVAAEGNGEFSSYVTMHVFNHIFDPERYIGVGTDKVGKSTYCEWVMRPPMIGTIFIGDITTPEVKACQDYIAYLHTLVKGIGECL